MYFCIYIYLFVYGHFEEEHSQSGSRGAAEGADRGRVGSRRGLGREGGWGGGPPQRLTDCGRSVHPHPMASTRRIYLLSFFLFSFFISLLSFFPLLFLPTRPTGRPSAGASSYFPIIQLSLSILFFFLFLPLLPPSPTPLFFIQKIPLVLSPSCPAASLPPLLAYHQLEIGRPRRVRPEHPIGRGAVQAGRDWRGHQAGRGARQRGERGLALLLDLDV